MPASFTDLTPVPWHLSHCWEGDARTVLAVLNNAARHNPRDEKASKTMPKSTVAWKIDGTMEKFTGQSTDTLACPLDGIVTQDGGL